LHCAPDMRLSAPVSLLLLLVTGCPADKADSATDTNPSEDTADTEDSGDTSPDPTTGDEPQTGGDTDAPPAACEEEDPSVASAFEVVLSDWPGMTTDEHAIDERCAVDSLAIEAGMVVSELSCDVDGQLLPATVRVAVSPAGSVTWKAGDGVRLESQRLIDDEFGATIRLLRLADADTTLHVVGVEAGDPQAAWFLPFTAEAAFPCGVEDISGGEFLPLRLDIGLGDADVSVFHAHRGVLPIDAGQVFAIDVGEASTNYCCHFTRKEEVLIRRVKLP